VGTFLAGEISGSHGGEHEDGRFLLLQYIYGVVIVK
jgi:hypothetical protein